MTNFETNALENVLHFTTIQEHGTFILYETFIFLLFEVFHFNFSQLPSLPQISVLCILLLGHGKLLFLFGLTKEEFEERLWCRDDIKRRWHRASLLEVRDP